MREDARTATALRQRCYRWLLVTYVARAATIAQYTVAVGPLVPPEETAGSGSTSH